MHGPLYRQEALPGGENRAWEGAQEHLQSVGQLLTAPLLRGRRNTSLSRLTSHCSPVSPRHGMGQMPTAWYGCPWHGMVALGMAWLQSNYHPSLTGCSLPAPVSLSHLSLLNCSHLPGSVLTLSPKQRAPNPRAESWGLNPGTHTTGNKHPFSPRSILHGPLPSKERRSSPVIRGRSGHCSGCALPCKLCDSLEFNAGALP